MRKIIQDEKEEWKSHMDLHLQKNTKQKKLRTDKGGRKDIKKSNFQPGRS